MSENKEIVSNKVVLMALKTLAISINSLTGVADQTYKRKAIDIFTTLRKNREHYDSKEIESWLILKADWIPQNAKRVADLAKGIQEGKRFTCGEKGPAFVKNIIEMWREEAKDPTQNSEEFRHRH